MTKNAIIGIVIVAAVVVAGGGYAIYSTQKGATQIAGENNNNTTPSENKKMAFSDFAKQGGSYKCTVTQNASGTTSQGTMYINGGMMRGDFDTQVNGATYQTHMIMKDDYSYIWSSAMTNTGFKTKVQATASGNTGSTSGQYSFNADQIGDYDCQAWNADASQFTLPVGISFTDTSSLQLPK